MPRLLAGFTDDAVWITGQSVARGMDELAALFEATMSQLLPTLSIQNLLADGDRVACQLMESLTHQSEQLTFFIAAFYRLRDGKIASAKVYREGSAVL